MKNLLIFGFLQMIYNEFYDKMIRKKINSHKVTILQNLITYAYTEKNINIVYDYRKCLLIASEEETL